MRLMNRNFTLVVIGQIISLFGNAILRFALPLYLLDETGSSTVFGTVMALSFVPMVLLSPVGGLLADRMNKRNIMVVLDFFTAGLTVFFLIGIRGLSPILLVTVVMAILSAIQSVYQPFVQASMPLLQEKGNLMTANAIINQVSALAGLLGPILGGIVYGVWGLIPLVTVSCICFFLSAVMEIFIRIPDVKQSAEGGILSMAKKDLRESFSYIQREQPIIQRVVVIIALFNLFLTSVLIVGIPVIIKIYLGLSSQLYGYTQGLGALGGLLGGVLIGVLAKRLKIQKAWKLLLITAILLLPIGMILMIEVPKMTAYIVVTAVYAGIMALATIFSVQMLAYVQAETPNHLVGKVVSMAMAVSMCAHPIGQSIYGILFERFGSRPYIVVAGSIVITIAIVLVSRHVFHNIPEAGEA